ncbi:HET-domain-containing protein [Hypoxylon trugodes]|uniref:HET-domain-containing protein n=1 Tax=Hypoxylon trugodes TaxID=326681 RepID=UPI00219D0FB3|nr:HET-domain-containing protein [Hypoxylon trugodes]KAI1384254.1 HET-domain-containing protein [Hypoxylon trugodes]
MAYSNSADKTVDDEIEHYQVVPLDRPCQHCKALGLDDAALRGTIKQSEDGTRFVDFGEVRQKNSETRGVNFMTLAAMAGQGNTDEINTIPKSELKLDYKRYDTIPDLPGFESTASQGCAFCKIFRKDLELAWDRIKDGVKQDFENGYQAKLTVFEVAYQLHEASYSGGDDKRICLDSLTVCFTVEWGSEESSNHSLTYNVCTDAVDPCASWLRIWRRPLSNKHLSPPSKRRLDELVAKSLLEVPAPTDNKYYPTRLLDVGSSFSTKLRLIITEKDPEFRESIGAGGIRYAALSYCWGSKERADKQLKTTNDTLQNHVSQIEFEKLPQTVVDAIQVCQALGIRYLWIDALCIIQDNAQDWAQEAFEMSNVYANSFITLCIAQGDSCLSGFLTTPHAPQMLKIVFQSKLDPSVKGKIYLRMQNSPRDNFKTSRMAYMPLVDRKPDEPGRRDIEGAAWNKRGWTFQEAWVSPRRLIFGQLMFHIDCGKLHESADGSMFNSYGLPSWSSEEGKSLLNSWYILVTQYGKRELSYESDRFPALSALARTISEKLQGQEYLAGLWKSDLHKGLLWSPSHWDDLASYLKRSEGKYVSPSWSWAYSPGWLSWMMPVGTDLYPTSPEFDLKSHNIAVEEFNSFGRVSSATLELYAKTFQFPLSKGEGKVIKVPDDERRWVGMNFHFQLLSDKDEYIASLRFDWQTLGKDTYLEDPIDKLWMVLISRSTLKCAPLSWRPEDRENKYLTSPEIMIGLLLFPTEREDEFVKVGLWFSETRGEQGGSKFWDDIPKRLVKLV